MGIPANEALGARISLRLRLDWPLVLLPSGMLPQVALDAKVSAIPACAPWFRGVVGRRGAVVPVFDIPASLGEMPADLDQARIVVLDPEGAAMAILCSEVPSVEAVTGPAPVNSKVQVPPGLHSFLDTPLAVGERVFPVFDPRRWLSAHAPRIAR